ncbi:MAG: prepilin-type N-terminal cleavage/methylation domain-containing protein [Planctomycetaceae bacterium]
MHRIARRPNRRRRGFTLVELLVAVALVVLMMTMFAEIFSLASNAVSTQKGAAVNDQKVRTFTTLLKSDLDSRTFREVMPFQTVDVALPAQQTAFTNAFSAPLPAQRRGYFSISENDPLDPTDDVLAFTIEVDQSKHGYRDAILYGKAENLSVKGGFADHPEFDDGTANDGVAPGNIGRGASTMAEIAYFLRNGNLYRSVRLIREPYAGRGPTDQPSNDLDADLFDNAEFRFWGRFNYSAYRHPFDAAIPASDKVMFHTVGSLINTYDGSGAVGLSNVGGANVPLVLGIPHLRFGHTVEGDGGSGQPDEFVGGTFIGRWLQQEMADEEFTYPGTASASPTTAATGIDPNGIVIPFNDSSDTTDPSENRGAELLVPRVHEFDIQVWDDSPLLAAPVWTDVGGDDGGFYDASNNANTAYCPPNRYRFDTWHPRLGGPAPFRGIHVHDTSIPHTSPDGQPGVAGFDDDGDTLIDEISPGVPDPEEVGWVGSDDERPLRQIRVRVRFYDTKSGQVRQLTLTLPLTDNQSL